MPGRRHSALTLIGRSVNNNPVPKLVNVAERQEALVSAVLSLVSEGGLDTLTMRAVAEKANVSPGLVHHYFPGGKTELLHAAVTAAVERGVQRMFTVIETSRGLAAVRAAAVALLPVTAERRAEWTAWASLWTQILTVEGLRGEQADRLSVWRSLLETLLDQAETDGELRPGIDTHVVALQLAAFLDGLGLHSLIDPTSVPSEALEGQVDSFLATVAT